MEDVIRDIDEADVYIDDVGVFDKAWDKHLQSLRRVLQRLQDNNFTINPLKCEWGVQETDWLGYWLTPTGLKPWRKKIDAILQMDTPKNIKQLRSFIGAVTFYRDMWPHRSHLLAPLTQLTGTRTFTWGPEQDEAFQTMKALIAEDAMIKYPDHNLPFDIFTDASDYQLGSVIMQDGMPVAYYSRKLNDAQKNYTTMEKELLSIVETLKEYRTMLYGAKLHVHTDHRNLTYMNLNSQRVMRWRLALEDYSPTFSYIKGPQNVVADALSRVPRSQLGKGDDTSMTVSQFFDESKKFDELYSESYAMEIDDLPLTDCFLMHPDYKGNRLKYPLDFKVMAEQQDTDEDIQWHLTNNPQQFQKLQVFGETLTCYLPDQDSWRVVLPTGLVGDIIQWYHVVLGHCGTTRLRDAMTKYFWHPSLRESIEEAVKALSACQLEK